MKFVRTLLLGFLAMVLVGAAPEQLPPKGDKVAIPGKLQSLKGQADQVLVGVIPEQLTCLLGGARGGKILTATQIAPRRTDGERYQLFDLSGKVGEVTALGRPVHEGAEGECSELWRLELGLDPKTKGRFMAALRMGAKRADPLPKTLQVLSQPLDEHKTLLRKFLSRREVPTPKVRFEQVIKADLDGDGVPEFILNAISIGKEKARRGDYSIVLVVRGRGRAQRTFIVQDEVTLQDSPYPSTLWSNKIVAILDVDGDGQMEIVTSGAYLFGGGWEMVRFEDGAWERILFCGCDG
ncbi:MAG: hypothetical protein ACTSY1_05645 [Alphaproteobacteria bacterium]